MKYMQPFKVFISWNKLLYVHCANGTRLISEIRQAALMHGNIYAYRDVETTSLYFEIIYGEIALDRNCAVISENGSIITE